MGPLVTRRHRDKVSGYIDAGVGGGAELLVDGGAACNCRATSEGYFSAATLFDPGDPEMSIYREEIFGPVLSITRAPDYATAAKLINDHDSATQRDLHPRRRRGPRLRPRDRGRHGRHQRADPGADGLPLFGGLKASLFGDHHMHGPGGVRFYTRLKTITTRCPPASAPARIS